MHVKHACLNGIYNRLPEEEHSGISGSKHVEDIKIKIEILI
jgi:hypothetical protein